jgi:hypothetical protein
MNMMFFMLGKESWKYLCFIFTTNAEVGRFAQGKRLCTNNKSEHGARRTAFKRLVTKREEGRNTKLGGGV